MESKIKKWGNSLAIRIPKVLADELALYDETVVDLNLDEGRLVVTPRRPDEPSLAALLDQISAENLHGEIDSGPPQGHEAW